MDSSDLEQLLKDKGIRKAEIARRMAVGKSLVTKWVARRVPSGRVLGFEQVTGIPRHEIRPDLYPPPNSSQVIFGKQSFAGNGASRTMLCETSQMETAE